MDKRAELKKLAIERQETRWPPYTCIGDYCDGAYECDFVSPYTKTAGNVNSEIFVMLQDWSSHEFLSRRLDTDAATLGHTPRLPTNRKLTLLLQTFFGMTLKDVYGTNLFPFIKPEKMGTGIPKSLLVKAAIDFALPQIRIVRPKLVI